MKTDDANAQWFDAIVRHQIFSIRAAGAIRNEVNRILDKTEAELAMQIRDALRGDATYSPARLAKAQRLLKRIKSIRETAWVNASQALKQSLTDLTQGEASFLSTALGTVVPVVLEASMPSSKVLKALVTDKPFEGRTLKEWAAGLRSADLRRIEDQIKIGLVRGEDSSAIARRVIGMKGVTQITRNQVQAVTRTAVNHYSNAAQQEFLSDNKDLFDEEIFVATLDSRTTPICRSLDGKRFPVGEGPIPPLHFGCRSFRVAAISAEAIGVRPAKPFTEQQLVREYAKQEGLDPVSSRDDLPYGTKGDYDDYAMRRMRELTGQVPATTTYEDWLAGQSESFQDDVLGPTRGKLFRDGDLTLDQFVDKAGNEIPLADLAARDAGAFADAGLDPGKFLEEPTDLAWQTGKEISLGDLPQDAQDEVNQAIADVVEKYPELLDRFDGVTADIEDFKDPETEIAWTEESRGIHINPDYEPVLSTLERTGDMPEGAGLRYVAAHELGHQLYWAHREDFADVLGTVYQEVRDKVTPKITNDVGDAGSVFADVFAFHVTGRPLPPEYDALVKLIKEHAA